MSQQYKKYKQSHNLNLFYIILILIICTCSGQIKLREGEQKIVSGGKKPGWIFQTDNNFEVGISEPCASEAEARSRALFDARKKIIDRIGILLTKKQKEHILNRTDSLEDNIINTEVEQDIQTIALSRGLISVKAREYYIEKYAQRKFAEIEYFYIAHVLVPFSKEEHDALINKTFQETKNWFQKNYNQIVSSSGDDIKLVLSRIKKLEQACHSTKQIIGMKPDLLAIINRWESDLAEQKITYLDRISVIPLGNDQQIGTDRRLQKKIGIRLMLNNSPLQGVAVELTKDNKELISGMTDEKGEFLYYYDRPIIGKVKITAFPKIDDTMALSPIQFIFQNPIQVIVKIPELGINQDIPQNYVENAVIKCLLNNNIQINQGCFLSDEQIIQLYKGNFDIIADSSCINENLLLIGRAYAFDARRPDLNNELLEAKAKAEIKFIDPKSRSILWNLNITEDHGIGISPNAAGDNALEMLAKKIFNQVDEYFMQQFGTEDK